MREDSTFMSHFSFKSFAVVISIAAFSVFNGFVIALDPGAGLKLAISILAPVFLLILWNLPAARNYSYTLPHLLLGAYLFAAVVWPPYGFIKISSFPAVSPAKLLYASLLLVWLYSVFAVSDVRQRLMSRIKAFKPITISLLIFFLWRILSIPFSGEVFGAFKVVFEDIFSYLGMFLIALSLIRDRNDALRILKWLFFAAASMAIVGCYESVVKKSLFGGLVFIDESQMNLNMVEALREKMRDGQFRVQASFDSPLSFGEFLMLTVPLGFGLARMAGVLPRLIWFVPAIAASLYAALATGSRAALGGVVGALFITLALTVLRFVVHNRRDPRAGIVWLVMPLLILGGLAVVFFAKTLVLGNSTETAGSSYARLDMLLNALPYIASNPLTGHGAGAALKYVGILSGAGILTVDNYYLSVALDNGLPAMFALIAAFVSGTLAALRLALHKDLELARIGASLCAAILIFMLFKSILSIAGNMLFICFLLGILVILLEDAVTLVPKAKPAY